MHTVGTGASNAKDEKGKQGDLDDMTTYSDNVLCRRLLCQPHPKSSGHQIVQTHEGESSVSEQGILSV
jgi:hypothetical protein